MVKVPNLKSKKLSPLRYPGGKTRASVKLFNYIPEDTVSLTLVTTSLDTKLFSGCILKSL